MSCPCVFKLCSSFLHPEKRGGLRRDVVSSSTRFGWARGRSRGAASRRRARKPTAPRARGESDLSVPSAPSVGVALDVLPRSVGARARASSLPLPRGRSLSSLSLSPLNQRVQRKAPRLSSRLVSSPNGFLSLCSQRGGRTDPGGQVDFPYCLFFCFG